MKIGLCFDAHYGWKESQAPPVSQVFKELDVDTLIFGGDTIELWRRKIDDVIKENKESLKEMVQRNSVLIKGNHDFILGEVLNVDMPEAVYIDDFIIFHGYHVEVLSSSTIFTCEGYEEIARKLCYTNNSIGRFLSILWKGYIELFKSGSNREDRSFKEMIEFVETLAEITNTKMLFGHFHREYISDNVCCLDSLSNGVAYILDVDEGDLEKVKF